MEKANITERLKNRVIAAIARDRRDLIWIYTDTFTAQGEPGSLRSRKA
jgi:hypothetical protein